MKKFKYECQIGNRCFYIDLVLQHQIIGYYSYHKKHLKILGTNHWNYVRSTKLKSLKDKALILLISFRI